jgi:hypothetical protein
MNEVKPTQHKKQDHSLLKCSLPSDEALRRTMMVKPPKSWKKALRAKG